MPLTTDDLVNLAQIFLGIVVVVFLCFALFQFGMLLREMRRVTEKANDAVELARELIVKPLAIVASVQEGVRGLVAKFTKANPEDEDDAQDDSTNRA